ncbi:MAG: multicopper oxidase family protein [Thiolinea sp.]
MQSKNLYKVTGIGAAVAAGGLLYLQGRRADAMLPPFDLTKHQPERIHSVDGVLEYELEAKMAELSVNGREFKLRSFNGELPGKTLVVRPGDTLKIKLVNNLPATLEDHYHPDDASIPHGFNNVNYYTRGLNVSPEQTANNALLSLHPGEWCDLPPPQGLTAEDVSTTHIDYEIQIPRNHPSGAFAYQSLKQGAVLQQVASGMAGFLLVEGKDSLTAVPEIAAAQSVDIVFQELIVDDKGEMPAIADAFDREGTNKDRYPIHTLLNGEARVQYLVNGLAINEGEDSAQDIAGEPPVIHMRPGEVQHWRFGMMAQLQSHQFSLDGHELNVVARDGITQPLPSRGEQWLLASGSRTDFLVKANTKPGTYAFRIHQIDGQPSALGMPDMQEGLPVFNVVVSGTAMEMALPLSLNPPTRGLPQIVRQHVSRRRRLELKTTGELVFDQDGNKVSADTRKYYINNLAFNPARMNHTVALGAVEEWEITHTAEGDKQQHPVAPLSFHLQGNPLLLISMEDAAGKVLTPGGNTGQWRDSVNIPAGGKAVVRVRFQRHPGTFAYYSASGDQVDRGMMQLLEVVDSKPVVLELEHDEVGQLVSPDRAQVIRIDVAAGSFSDQDKATYKNVEVAYRKTKMLYFREVDPQHPPDRGDTRHHPDKLERVGLERYFRLHCDKPLHKAARVVISYPAELARGEKYDPATVRLYRGDGQYWTEQGIRRVELDQEKRQLVSLVDDLGDGYFAVMAKMTSGPVSEATSELITHIH